MTSDTVSKWADVWRELPPDVEVRLVLDQADERGQLPECVAGLLRVCLER